MITVLTLISLGFVCIQLLNATLNLIFRQKLSKTAPNIPSLISVLIPVRNEELNIIALLNSLKEINTPLIEIIVFNDQSTDNTAAILQECSKSDPRIRTISADSLPPGWLGKNWACHKLAAAAKGEYLLFLDADVTLSGNIIANTVNTMSQQNLGLLSIFPRQRHITLSEQLSVPLMNYILLTLLPLVLVRVSPFSSHSAANGQFMLFRAATYNKIQPHSLFRKCAVEDIAIAKYLKKNRIKVSCLTGDERVKCRMYTSYQESIKGFSKNIFMFFGNSPVLAFIFFTCATLGVVAAALYSNAALALYLLIVFLVQITYAAACGQNPFLTAALFPAHLFFMLQVIIRALNSRNNKTLEWKGRNIC